MRRLAAFGTAASAGFLVAALLGACGAPAGPGPTSTSPSMPSVPPLTSAPGGSNGAPTEAPSAPATPAPTAADWKIFKTADGQLQFDYPAEWTVKDRGAEAASGGVFLEVLTKDGKSLATLVRNVATGSECTQRIPYQVLDLVPVPALVQEGVTPQFIFELRLYPAEKDPMKANVMAYGISSAPKPHGPDACPIFHYFNWPPGGASFGGVYNPFDTSPGNEPHVDSPEAYLETSEFKDIRKMITSLRPAGQ